jgi:hypothetical protein
MRSPNSQWRVWAGVAVALVLIIIGAIANRPAKDPGLTGRYEDPNTHQIISNPDGKKPDSYGVANSTPIYIGFEKLLNEGVSFNQLNNLKLAFYNYSQSRQDKLTEVSLDPQSLKVKLDDEGNILLTFNVLLNRKETVSANVACSGIDAADLVIKDTSGKQLFDSGVIGAPTN